MARVNVTKGNEIEGLEIDDTLIGQLWPNASDTDFVNAIINATTLELVATAVRAGQTDPELAARAVVQYIQRIR